MTMMTPTSRGTQVIKQNLVEIDGPVVYAIGYYGVINGLSYTIGPWFKDVATSAIFYDRGMAHMFSSLLRLVSPVLYIFQWCSTSCDCLYSVFLHSVHSGSKYVLF